MNWKYVWSRITFELSEVKLKWIQLQKQDGLSLFSSHNSFTDTISDLLISTDPIQAGTAWGYFWLKLLAREGKTRLVWTAKKTMPKSYLIFVTNITNLSCCQIVRGAKLSTVPNCPRCQIVRSAKLSAVPNCSVPNCPDAKLSGAKLSAVPNCPIIRLRYWAVCV